MHRHISVEFTALWNLYISDIHNTRKKWLSSRSYRQYDSTHIVLVFILKDFYISIWFNHRPRSSRTNMVWGSWLPPHFNNEISCFKILSWSKPSEVQRTGTQDRRWGQLILKTKHIASTSCWGTIQHSSLLSQQFWKKNNIVLMSFYLWKMQSTYN